MAKELEIEGMITDITSKVGRKGNRFCILGMRIPTDAESVKILLGLQGKSLSMDITLIQKELFTEDE